MLKLNIVCCLCIYAFILSAIAKKPDDQNRPEWAKKDVRYWNDDDMDRLLEQWDEDDDTLETYERAEYIRANKDTDFSNVDVSERPELIKMLFTDNIKTFVKLTGERTKYETYELGTLWKKILLNNSIHAMMFMQRAGQVIYVYRYGREQAIIAKDFFVEQKEVKEVNLNGELFYDKHTREYADHLEEIRMMGMGMKPRDDDGWVDIFPNQGNLREHEL